MNKHYKQPDASVELVTLNFSQMELDILADLPAQTVGDLLTFKTEGVRSAYTDYYNAHASSSTMDHYEWELGWQNLVKQINKICKPFAPKGEKAFSKIQWTVENAISGNYNDKVKKPKKHKLPTTYRHSDLLSNLGLSKFTDDVLTDIHTVGDFLELTIQDHLRIFSDYYMDYKDTTDYKNIAWRKYWKRYMKEVNRIYGACRGGIELVVLDWTEDMAVFQRQKAEDEFDEDDDKKHKKQTYSKLELEVLVETYIKFDYADTFKILNHYWRFVEENEDGMSLGDLIDLNADDLYDAFQQYMQTHSSEMLLQEFYDDLNNHVTFLRDLGSWVNPIKPRTPKTKMKNPSESNSVQYINYVKEAMRHLRIFENAIKAFQAEQDDMLQGAIAALVSQRDRLCESDTAYRDAQILIDSYNMIAE